MNDHHHDHHHEEHDDAAGTASRTCCGACREGKIGTGSCASATNAMLRRDILIAEVSSDSHGSATLETGSRAVSTDIR